MQKTMLIAFIIMLSCFIQGETTHEIAPDPMHDYLETDFLKAAGYYENKKDLLLVEKLFLIECLARGSREIEAMEKLEPLLRDPSLSEHPGLLATSGTVHLSFGHMEKAGLLTARALERAPGLKQALVTAVMTSLYNRDFMRAKKNYEKLRELDLPWKNSTLMFNLGLEVYNALGDSKKLAELYSGYARLKKKSAPKRYENLRSNGKMFNKIKNRDLYSLDAKPGTTVIPFHSSPHSIRFNMIPMRLKKKAFYVLLDTGNSTGWMLHNLELEKYLKPRDGGHTVNRIGTGASMWSGKRQYYKVVTFGGFTIRDVHGVFMPKPHWKFPDANLNPCFIRDRVVTLDFIENKLILQTSKEFQTYMENIRSDRYTRLRWYGHRRPYVPVTVMGKKTLALIETGAEDISFRYDFISQFDIPLKPKTKYLANGNKYSYHLADITLNLKQFKFFRKQAEVWPFKKIYHPITGMTPAVIFGPKAFKDRYTISFNPYNKEIIIRTR